MFSVTGGPSYFGNYPVSVDLNKGVYIGTYSEVDEKDLHNPEVIDLLVKELGNSLEEPPVEGFDRFGGRNIGMDGKNVYVYAYLPDIAFHDYVILSIPLDEVIN